MTIPEDILDDELSGAKIPEMFTPTAIMWYAVLFTPAIGGVLFFSNLLAQKRATLGWLVLIGCALYSTLVIYLTFLIPLTQSRGILLLIFNLVGGNILTVPLWRSIIGKINYQKKNPWKPLAVILAVYIIALLVRYFWLSFELPPQD